MEAATLIQSVWRSYKTRAIIFSLVPHMIRMIKKECDTVPYKGEKRILYDTVWRFVRKHHEHPLYYAVSSESFQCSLCKNRETGVRWKCNTCVHVTCEECFYIRYM